MSALLNETCTDESEEDSREQYLHSSGDLVIDESNEETIELSASHFGKRESNIFPVVKRAVRPLDDSDSESDREQTPIVTRTKSTLGLVGQKINDQSASDDSEALATDESCSLLELKQKQSSGKKNSNYKDHSQHISDSDDNITPDAKSKKNSHLIESESDNSGMEDGIMAQPYDSAMVNASQSTFGAQNSTKLAGWSQDFSRTPNCEVNLLNLTQKMAKSRISQQFQPTSEGILNSTAIGADMPINDKYRLSNGNFNNIQEESESRDSSLQILSDHDSDIIEVSSDESPVKEISHKLPKPKQKFKFKQQSLTSYIVKSEPVSKPMSPVPEPKKNYVNSSELAKNANSDDSNHRPSNISSDKGHKSRTPEENVENSNTNLPELSFELNVSRSVFENQRRRVSGLQEDYLKITNMVRTLNLEALPDKGKLLKEKEMVLGSRLMKEQEKLQQMIVTVEDVNDSEPVVVIPDVAEVQKEVHKPEIPEVAWEDIQEGLDAVQPKTHGKQALSTYNAQKAVTLDRLQQLHGALATCPKENDMEEDPKGLKVPLMPHQKRALAWLMFREKEKPSGGILADDMGLGKTLTMLSLIVKMLEINRANEDEDEENHYMEKNTKFKGGTLIVCPASLLNQWSGEIESRLKRGLISFVVYHGPKRETKAQRLAQYDVVITTYSIINNEVDKRSAAFRIKWRRIILDEAHQIRNYKCQTSEACCQLMAQSRWALTGTPMHNKEADMYALLKFLRCSPFDDLTVWKRWVSDKSTGGQERLHTVISSLMLRRTKAELMTKGTLQCLPEKKWELVTVQLDDSEMQIYHKVLIFSRTLFAQFLHQRAEKRQDYYDQNVPFDPSQDNEYAKMRQKLLKLNKVKNVSQHEILVLLLRLRQICCHPSLISAMLDEGEVDIGKGDEECEEMNLLEQINNLKIDGDDKDEDEYKPSENSFSGISEEQKVSLKEASKGHLNPSDPVFSTDRASSKIKALLKVLKQKVLKTDDKAIVVSQWSSYLKLVAVHLKSCYVKYDQLDGSVPVHKRMDMVNSFNNPKDPMKVLLLSLTAGGVGLNLVGANHLFLLDLHWNPQLENQAQDRIYRFGQTKPVFVYKFMALDTIEERIKALQDRKLEMAENILTGTKQVIENKLSLADLKMIFGM